MGGEALRYDKYPYYQITSKEIEALDIPWTMLDKIPPNFAYKPIFILNLDQSTGEGAHWTLVGTNIRRKEVFYFDPLGRDNDGQYNMKNSDYEKKTGCPTELSIWAKQQGFVNVHVNSTRFQFLKSWMCGFIVLYLAKHIDSSAEMIRKATQNGIEGWNNTLTSLLGVQGPSPKLIQKVMNWWEQAKIKYNIN